MMIRRKLLLLLAFVFIFGFSNSFKSQSNVAILLNEYSASNTGGPNDAFGAASDWVELRNAHTASVSLASYYLSNDRNNLFKWKFPADYTIPAGGLKAVWLSGKNVKTLSGEYHANFTLEQCKNQWLILSTSAGVVRDSIFIQKTKAGHSRGRVDETSIGVGAWRLYTSHSFLINNPLVNNYLGYCPTPKMASNPLASPLSPTTSNTGGFYPGTTPIIYFKLESNLAYDSTFSCFNIYYTTDGSYPVPGVATLYPDSINGTTGDLSIALTGMVRAIAIPKPAPACNQNYLPSFCETNTYFVEPEHNNISADFGVISLAMDKNWFNTNGAFSPTVHVEYYDKGKQVSEGYSQLFKPTQEEWKTKQRGMYINLDDRQGFGCAFEGQVFNVDLLGTTTRTFFPTLHLKAGDIESSSIATPGIGTGTEGTGLRDVVVQSIAAKYNIDVNPLRIKPVVAFINGDYYGVFDLREVYDKHYENYYHSQSKDSLTLSFYHNSEGSVSYVDQTSSNFNYDFKTKIYDVVTTKPMNSPTFYNQVMAELDKNSFIDYMIMNSYIQNSDIWNFNVGYARGGQSNFPGGKWHYYLWNTPTAFNFQGVKNNTYSYGDPNLSPCNIHYGTTIVSTATVSPLAGNSHGIILNRLMYPVNPGAKANKDFQLQYKNRYQDLLNGPLKCENILKHFDAVYELYKKEMTFHSDPTTGIEFGTAISPDPFCWDSNMVRLRKKISQRCYVVETAFTKPGCYGMTGPHNITVDVRPDSSAGKVKLNSEILPDYIWNGRYYTTTLSFKAIPTNTTFVFDHWEFKNPQSALGPLSMDSIGFAFNQYEEVVAVFTDKTKELVADGENANVPTGFTPNGDLMNDVFRPLGSANFTTDYEMTIWSRWGEEVFRSTSPSFGWDGTYKGKEAITGVYAYVIKYKNIYGESKVLKGNVTLTR